jgi:uroporphyrinogen-III synthase
VVTAASHTTAGGCAESDGLFTPAKRGVDEAAKQRGEAAGNPGTGLPWTDREAWMDGMRVGVTSFRKGEELVAALRRRGAAVLHGPTVGGDEPVPERQIIADTVAILDAGPDWLVASTGVGMRLWIAAATAHGLGPALGAMAQDARCVARGAKAVGGLHQLGVRPVWSSTAQTDADVAGWLAGRVLPGEVVAVQLHGGQVGTTFAPVAAAGADLVSVATYRHALPEDIGPARRLVREVVDGSLDVVTFTSPGAARNLVTVAAGMRPALDGRLLDAFRTRVATAAIGPVTSSALEELGIPVWITPARWHTGDLLRALGSWAERRPVAPCAPPRLRLVPTDHSVIAGDGHRVVLGERGYAVLASLARRPGVVVAPSQLLAEAWGHTAPHDESAIKHQVARLRRKLAGTGVDIHTVRGVGYRLEATAAS